VTILGSKGSTVSRGNNPAGAADYVAEGNRHGSDCIRGVCEEAYQLPDSYVNNELLLETDHEILRHLWKDAGSVPPNLTRGSGHAAGSRRRFRAKQRRRDSQPESANGLGGVARLLR
jgi:hypothetical protein